MKADIEVFICILFTFSFANGSENIHPACQNMWDNAGNNLVVPHELKVDAVDNANPLFKVLSAGAGKVGSPEFQRFKVLMGDYRAVRPAPTQQHIDAFLTAVTQPGGPMQAAFDYLKQKRLLPPGVTTLQQFKGVLNDLWFRNSNGFKHVFVGDLNANTFTGFHNWYQFLLEQERNPTQTTNILFRPPPHLPPFVGNKLPYFLRGLTFRWRGANKVPQGSTSSMFVGTSPAFDLAMFTTCVLKGRAAGGETTDCVCEIQDPRLGKSTAEFRTIENSRRKVVTAYPRNVKS